MLASSSSASMVFSDNQEGLISISEISIFELQNGEYKIKRKSYITLCIIKSRVGIIQPEYRDLTNYNHQ